MQGFRNVKVARGQMRTKLQPVKVAIKLWKIA
jgi:hypothetical protein